MMEATRRLIAILILLTGTALSAQNPACPAAQPKSNMELTFDSEFAADGVLKPDQWRVFVGQHGPPDQEAQVYLPDNVHALPKVGLRIDAEKREYWGHSYTSGWIATQGLFSQTYGHFEALAKMPQANGAWPAFWLVGENGWWPPEIDVVEYIYAPHGKHPDKSIPGQGSTPETTLHWADATGAHKLLHQGWGSNQPRFYTYDDWGSTPPLKGLGDAYAGYHLYAIDWRPGSLVWLIDNKPVFCLADDDKSGDRIPHTPMYMILNDAISGGTQAKPGWSGYVEPTQAFPLNFDVAYVRAYQFKDIADPPALALDIRDVTVSNPEPAPGDTITFHATLKVGASDLGKGKLAFTLYDFLDPRQYNGIKSTLAALSVSVPSLAAHQSYPLQASYTIPPGTPAGIYGVDAKATYTDGPGNDIPGQWPRGIRLKQALTFTVTAQGAGAPLAVAPAP